LETLIQKSEAEVHLFAQGEGELRECGAARRALSTMRSTGGQGIELYVFQRPRKFRGISWTC